MKKKIVVLTLFLLLLFGVSITIIDALQEPCTDAWSRCIEINGYPDVECDELWEICMRILYDWEP